MQIVEWNLQDIGRLTNYYNQQCECLPFSYPLTPPEFEVGIQNEGWQLEGSRIFVAKENRETAGFVHVIPPCHITPADTQERGRRIGYIAFFVYTPGYRTIGQALLEKAEAVLMEIGVDEIHTVYGYECHEFGIGGVTHRWPHVLGLLGANGYKVTDSDLFLIAQDFEVQDPTPPIDCNDLQVRIYYYTGRAPIVSPRVHVFDGEQVVVKHGTESVAHYYPSAKKAAQQLYTFGVSVRKPYRGQGWGRFVLQKVLWEARKLGYRDAILSTGLDNYQAQLLYASCGYRGISTSSTFKKILKTAKGNS